MISQKTESVARLSFEKKEKKKMMMMRRGEGWEWYTNKLLLYRLCYFLMRSDRNNKFLIPNPIIFFFYLFNRSRFSTFFSVSYMPIARFQWKLVCIDTYLFGILHILLHVLCFFSYSHVCEIQCSHIYINYRIPP